MFQLCVEASVLDRSSVASSTPTNLKSLSVSCWCCLWPWALNALTHKKNTLAWREPFGNSAMPSKSALLSAHPRCDRKRRHQARVIVQPPGPTPKQMQATIARAIGGCQVGVAMRQSACLGHTEMKLALKEPLCCSKPPDALARVLYFWKKGGSTITSSTAQCSR